MAKVPDNVAAAVAAAVGVAKAAQAAQDAVSYAKAAQATDRAVTYAQAAQTTQKAVTTAKRAQRPRPRPKRRYTHPEAKKVARRVVERGLEKGLSRRQMVKATERITQRLGWDDPQKPSRTPGGRRIQSPPKDLHRQAARAVDRYLSAPTSDTGPVNTERPEPRKPVRRDPSDPNDGPVNTERPVPKPPRSARKVLRTLDRKVDVITGKAPSPQEKRRVTRRLEKAADKSGGKFLDDTLNPDQQEWARAFSKELGVSLDFAAAEALREGGNGTPGDNNWANIGWTDSGPVGVTKAPEWRDPTTAGKTTAKWIKGEWGDQYDYNPAEGILEIGRLAKSGASEQEIGRQWARSGWASAGAGPLDTLGDVPISEGAKVPAQLKRKARQTIGPINTKAILKDVDLSSAEKVKNPDQRRAVRSILVGKVPAGAEGLLGKAAVKALEQGGKIVKGSKRKLSATEVFYDGADSYYDNGTWTEGQFGDHGDHVHFASEDPASILLVARKAQELGMLQGGVGENPAFDTLDAHDPSSGSYHVREMDMPEGLKGLRKATGASGPVLGEALDIAGSPEQMAAMQKWIAENLGEGVATGPRIKGTDLQVIVPAEEGSAGTSSGTGISTGASTGGTSTGSTGKGKKQKARRRRRPLPSAQLDDDALGTYLAVGADTPVDPFIERLIELQQS